MIKSLPTFATIGVIVGRDLIGDALIKLPFLRALRNAFPQAEINWITSQGQTAYAAQLRQPTEKLIDKIHETPSWLETVSEQQTPFGLQEWVGLARQAAGLGKTGNKAPAEAPSFDLIIDTRNRWREAVYAQRIPHKLFISPAMQFLFSEKRPPFFEKRPVHLCDRLLKLVELAAGFRPPSTGALSVNPGIMEKAKRILPPGHTYVGLAPGSGYRDKAWPRFKFEKIAMLQAEKNRVPVFILGPQELNWYDELVATVQGAKFPLQEHDVWGTDVISLDHTLALGSLLDVAVANDSGVGHMLAAADCPLITLFGPTSPDKLAPRVTYGKIIMAQDYGSWHMREIPWEAVNSAIDEMLTKKTSSSAG